MYYYETITLYAGAGRAGIVTVELERKLWGF